MDCGFWLLIGAIVLGACGFLGSLIKVVFDLMAFQYDERHGSSGSGCE